ncbi:FAD-dependent oxidoreductase [Cryomorpha ignava]|uniref:D-amino-acid oxidase n=1 Tax=Cryomorpha ignava TaxID=101383 RepID=A0A7K3WWT1_9FLAO|nr:FAD-dependent oxidoreductase [Cryomorpha ignava]NEN25085.1 FAD-dependent oxidoreductase [Cryomorpha ignava]
MKLNIFLTQTNIYLCGEFLTQSILYFILGQGLAGTCLAIRFHEKNIPFQIFDNGYKSSSSIVAAGLWNPIVFRRITKSWRADELTRSVRSFYPHMESVLGVSFFHPSENIRFHSSPLERDEWSEKRYDPEFEDYLFATDLLESNLHITKRENGYGLVKQTGSINLPVFLNSARSFFKNHGYLISRQIDLPDSVEGMLNYSIDGMSPERIIDCRGSKAATSPWWNYLPFNLSKGEVLTISCPGLNLDNTLNSGVFVLPLGNDHYRVGATFSWEDINPEPTDTGRNELIEKLEKLIALPFQIINHQAGLRPSVADRRPLMGSHPACNKLVIFNGLGTKGVMLAPYFSETLCAFLVDGKELAHEIDILRFNKRYLKSL